MDDFWQAVASLRDALEVEATAGGSAHPFDAAEIRIVLAALAEARGDAVEQARNYLALHDDTQDGGGLWHDDALAVIQKWGVRTDRPDRLVRCPDCQYPRWDRVHHPSCPKADPAHSDDDGSGSLRAHIAPSEVQP